MPKVAKEAEPSFEKDMDALEQIVTDLEEGGLSLDDSLKRFEEGSRLALRCEKALQEAEKKIEILTKNASGELVTKPFEEEETSGTTPRPATKRSAPIADDDDIPLEPENGEDTDELLF